MSLPARYPAYAPVIAAGQAGRCGLRHIALCCMATLLLGYMLSMLLVEAVIGAGVMEGPDAVFDTATPASMLVLLLSFAVWPVALALPLHVIHARGLASVPGTGALAQFRTVLAMMLVLHLALALLPPWGAPGLQQNTALLLWLALLPAALLAVLVQVAAEELLFRGYLQQALAARGLPAPVWMGLPALIFGLGHYDAGAGGNAWLIVLWAVLFGVLMADLTARAGSIGPAVAVHLANNVLALLLVGLEGELSGLALYTYPLSMADEAAVRALLPVDFVLMIVSWLAARLALRR